MNESSSFLADFIRSTNMVDFFIAISFIIFTIRGVFRGFIEEVTGLLIVYMGFILARQFHAVATTEVQAFVQHPVWSALIAYIIIFFIVAIIISILARLILKLMDVTFTGWLDNLLGALAGALKGLALSIIGVLSLRFINPQSSELKKSMLYPWIERFVDLAQSLLPNIQVPGA